MSGDLIRAAAAGATGIGNWRRANCPLCVTVIGKPDRDVSFGIHLNGRWHCFRCGSRGYLDPASAGLPPLPEETAEPVKKEPTEAESPPEGFEPLGVEPGRNLIMLERARQFLLRRNVSPETWKATGLGATLEGDHARRIIVPVLGRDGSWVGWVGRRWKSSKGTGWAHLDYRYPSGMRRGEMMWNQNVLEAQTDTPVVVVEGVMDGLPHYPHTVACLGKPGKGHKKLLLKTERPIIVALDGDSWIEGKSLHYFLKLKGKRSSFLRLPPRTDPGDLEPGELIAMAEARL